MAFTHTRRGVVTFFLCEHDQHHNTIISEGHTLWHWYNVPIYYLNFGMFFFFLVYKCTYSEVRKLTETSTMLLKLSKVVWLLTVGKFRIVLASILEMRLDGLKNSFEEKGKVDEWKILEEIQSWSNHLTRTVFTHKCLYKFPHNSENIAIKIIGAFKQFACYKRKKLII